MKVKKFNLVFGILFLFLMLMGFASAGTTDFHEFIYSNGTIMNSLQFDEGEANMVYLKIWLSSMFNTYEGHYYDIYINNVNTEQSYFKTGGNLPDGSQEIYESWSWDNGLGLFSTTIKVCPSTAQCGVNDYIAENTGSYLQVTQGTSGGDIIDGGTGCTSDSSCLADSYGSNYCNSEDNVVRNFINHFCNSGTCSSTTTVELVDDCSATETCDSATATCQTIGDEGCTAETVEADCGTDSNTSNYCGTNNNLYRNVTVFSCILNSCSNTTTTTFFQTCPTGCCSGGSCVTCSCPTCPEGGCACNNNGVCDNGITGCDYGETATGCPGDCAPVGRWYDNDGTITTKEIPEDSSITVGIEVSKVLVTSGSSGTFYVYRNGVDYKTISNVQYSNSLAATTMNIPYADGDATFDFKFRDGVTASLYDFTSVNLVVTKQQTVICDLSQATMSWTPSSLTFTEGNYASATATVSGITGCGGLQAVFSIYESDFIGDDFIEDRFATVSTSGTASVSFSVDSSKVDTGKDWGETYPLKFIVKDLTAGSASPAHFSDELLVTMEDAAVCGNNILESGEGCDDGNLVNGDGCSSVCIIETDNPVCGNLEIETGETCDDGNLVNGDGCSSVCIIETDNPVCGNTILEAGEECDDGNLVNGDGCSSTCETETPVCGNNILEFGEGCDDGNLVNGDGCSSVCIIETDNPVCGNLEIETGETCDDGNLVNDDGCSSTCEIEIDITTASGEWRDSEGIAWIDNYTLVNGNVTTFKIYISGITNPINGATLIIEIKEKDIVDDDEITTINANMLADGTAVGTFTTSYQTFLDASTDDADNDYEFYFIINYDSQDKSFENDDILEVFIDDTETCAIFRANGNLCNNYTNMGQCAADTCGVNESSGAAVGIDCTAEGIDCYCEVDETGNACRFGYDYTTPDGAKIGSCDFNEDMSLDDCNDGFLSYNWTALWTWHPSNLGFSSNQGAGFVYWTDGKWYYDPQNASADCDAGFNTIACPAQVQLSGFTWVNLVIALIIVAIIYYLFVIEKKKKAKQKNSGSKKKRK